MDDTRLDAGLPANIDAERTILGAVLLNVEAHAEIADKVKPDHFLLQSHQFIFERMTELVGAGRAVDIVTLAESLAQHKEIEAIGGVSYLASLTEGLPRRPVISEYIRIVKDKALLRRIMAVCSLTIARSADQSETGLDVLSSALDKLSDLEYSAMDGAELESVGQWLDQNDIFEERIPGIPTGIKAYDELTGGLHPGELTIFAGRTSMGKTSHCCTVSWQIAKRGYQVGVFINEQQKSSFIGRMLCGRSGVSFKSYRAGALDMIERVYIQDARDEFRKLPIFIDQRHSMSVSSIRAKAARLKRTGELDVILIDQLNRVSNEGFWEKGKRGDEIIGDKVSAIQGIGQELEIPVILYHQLNRETTRNEEGRPTLVNLKNSGAIEEHADNIALLHRPGYYTRSKEDENKAEIILAKQRDGETDTVGCEFLGYNCLWQDRRRS